MRQNQRGKFNLFTLFLILVLVVAGYAAKLYIPVYIEKSRISRLVKQAANQLANVTPDIDEVKKDLAYNLEVAQVTSITAQDVNFAWINDNEVQAWVDYEVEIDFPRDILEPRVLSFSITHTAERSVYQ